jgi:hypothetical protein
VCYYYGPRDSVYEELGHAEVVQLELHGDAADAESQMRAFARAYFRQFTRTPFGMMRLVCATAFTVARAAWPDFFLFFWVFFCFFGVFLLPAKFARCLA